MATVVNQHRGVRECCTSVRPTTVDFREHDNFIGRKITKWPSTKRGALDVTFSATASYLTTASAWLSYRLSVAKEKIQRNVSILTRSYSIETEACLSRRESTSWSSLVPVTYLRMQPRTRFDRPENHGKRREQ